MQKINIFLLTILIPCSAYATCESTSSVTKCATVPNYIASYSAIPGDYTDNSWRFLYRKTLNNDEPYHYYSGTSAQITTNGMEQYLYCYMTSPFKTTIKAVYDMEYQTLMTSNPYEGCANHLRVAYSRELFNISVPSDDECPDGFYTVPYDVSCGVGLVDTTDIPNCSDDTSGSYCLISHTVPCASGITVLRTSSGVSVPLWGDKQTSPAIHVRYNDITCYGNLESGQSANAINLKYNGTVYHTIN